MNDSDIRAASQQHWGNSAESWARSAEEPDTGVSAEAATWMLAAADLQAGERILEIACGAGRVGLQAASMVGPGGTVLCSDFSEAMVDSVKERAARLGMANVTAQVLDAEHLDPDEAQPFDAVLCRFGYMLMADPLQALRESGRVLRPGGRLVLAVWGAPEKNLWLSIILDAVMKHLDAPPPKPEDPGPFALGTGRLQETMERAGLVEVELAEIRSEETQESLGAWWDHNLERSGPLSAVLAALPDADQSAIRAAAISAAEEFATPDGSVVFPSAVVGAKAQKTP